MARPHLCPIRVHGRGWLVVPSVLALAILSLVRPAGAHGPPVDPVPTGVWPLPAQPPTHPQVVRGFDPPDDPFGSGHRGVDLAGVPGEPVLSALAGTITFAGSLAGRGVVVVDHGATRTTYEPVAASVRVGQPVLQGHRLGVLELAGSHCPPGACLHWGWRRGDTYLDPLLLVGGGAIRLLPLWTGSDDTSTTPLPVAPPVTPPFAPLALLRTLRPRAGLALPPGRARTSRAPPSPRARGFLGVDVDAQARG
jgi:murein DD-endopeptidase MepM/ murein hydrolase activator NlpD